MKLNPESIARASSHRPWRTIGVWVLVMAAAGAAAGAFLSDVLTTSFDFTDNPESKQALTLVEDRLRGPTKLTEYVIVTTDGATALDPQYQQFVAALSGRIGEELLPEKVDFVGSFLTQTGPVSEDGRTALLPVQMARTDLDEESKDAAALAAAVAGVDVPPGFDVLIAGQGTVNNDYVHLSEETLRRGEGIGVAIALIVLLVVIGTVVAALLPLALAVAAITAAMGVASLIGLTFDLSFFVTNMISGIGLAVGIDYALFIVARYREERVRGFDKLEAIGRAGATANRAVFFSGMTVVLALVGMLFVPNTIFRSLGVGAIVVVVFAVAASMSLLPAILSLLGDRVNKGRVRRQRALDNVDKVGGFWEKATTAVMKRPVVWLVSAAGLMLLLAVFYLQIELGFAGVSTLPDGIESKQAFGLLEQEFAGGLTNPVEVVIDGPITPEVEAALGDLRAAVAADPVFGPFDPINSTEVNEARDLALFSFPLAGDFQSETATAAVRTLRAETVPAVFAGVDASVLVGGFTAFTVDFFADVDTYTPIVFLFVLGLSFLLLTIVFRSLVVPIKAIILNLLSVGAAYGMVALFFMADVGPSWVKSISEFLGFIEVESIEAWLPLFLFSVLFGLSMDYHVFLISRIREAYDRTGDNTIAVAHGLQTTGAIITGAALIMVAVFSGFAAGDVASLQQMGFGLAVAVFLDATVVRSILVPATMRLLGNLNWYLPSWLEWLPKVEIEGHEAAAAAQELVGVSD
jgi:RND superfamily putative drug exporter